MLELLNQLDGFDARSDVKVAPPLPSSPLSCRVDYCCNVDNTCSLFFTLGDYGHEPH